jgi:hypothetical protein
MSSTVDPDRLRRCYGVVKDLLLRERTPAGHWVGELSTSALSTATAVMALLQVVKGDSDFRIQDSGNAAREPSSPKPSTINQKSDLDTRRSTLDSCIARGLDWLMAHQNPDGGWGDTVKSFSNISTAMLCHAVLRAAEDRGGRKIKEQGSRIDEGGAAGTGGQSKPLDPKSSNLDPRASTHYPLPTTHFSLARAQAYIDRAGGIPALKARYGKDKTFSVPILTHCALAGLVDWKEITPLPFELACIPARFYKTVRLPVVSYALPALIAIGQVRHHFAPTWNPITRLLRNLAKKRSLAILERIQPPNGGFLEATPLTSFVTMSLAAMGLIEHPVVRKGVEFIVNSVRPDGSWPIDTNLATWVTTLSVNALGDDLPAESRLPILNWLLDQQYQEVHPFTNADPGGWAWTDLPGGVPDADDTAGAVLAVLQLSRELSVVSGQQDDGGQSEDSGIRIQDSGSESPAVATAGTGASGQQSTASDQPSAVSEPQAKPGVHHGDTETLRAAGLNSAAPRSEAPAGERPRREAPLHEADPALATRVERAVVAGVKWLLDLQNRDGGFPTFCRGWGALPFDRSSPDITSHCIRGCIEVLLPWNCFAELAVPLRRKFLLEPDSREEGLVDDEDAFGRWCDSARRVGSVSDQALDFLRLAQRSDGSWLPLWFGNQHAVDDINPTYGSARVLCAYRDCGLLDTEEAQRGMTWLRMNQNPDGGWGSGSGTPSSVEETALAMEALLDDLLSAEHVSRGINWLLDKIDSHSLARDVRGGKLRDHGGPGWSEVRRDSSLGNCHLSLAIGAEATPAITNDKSAMTIDHSTPLAPGAGPRTIADPAPIGFYFAKLWYFERLYPLIFAVSCLRRAVVKFPTGTGETPDQVSDQTV